MSRISKSIETIGEGETKPTGFFLVNGNVLDIVVIIVKHYEYTMSHG